MHVYRTTLASFILLSHIVSGRPLDASQPHRLIPRVKSYNVINVDGGTSSTDASPQQATKTIEIINAGPTVTATSIQVASTPAATSSGSRSTSSLSSKSTPSSRSTVTSSSTLSATITSSPQVITVIVTKDDGQTSYYDNGLWHTHYRVKTFKAVTTAAAFSSSLATSTLIVLPTLTTASTLFNQTKS